MKTQEVNQFKRLQRQMNAEDRRRFWLWWKTYVSNVIAIVALLLAVFALCLMRVHRADIIVQRDVVLDDKNEIIDSGVVWYSCTPNVHTNAMLGGYLYVSTWADGNTPHSTGNCTVRLRT